jgi:hypothetical protein
VSTGQLELLPAEEMRNSLWVAGAMGWMSDGMVCLCSLGLFGCALLAHTPRMHLLRKIQSACAPRRERLFSHKKNSGGVTGVCDVRERKLSASKKLSNILSSGVRVNLIFAPLRRLVRAYS